MALMHLFNTSHICNSYSLLLVFRLPAFKPHSLVIIVDLRIYKSNQREICTFIGKRKCVA